MAIDNAEKRRSVAGVRRGPRVTPNVAKDAEWRQQVGRTYSGIASGSPVVPEETTGRRSKANMIFGLGM